jgi:hypothetical protein
MSVLSIFRVLAAEFASVNDDTVNTWISLAEPLVNSKRFGNLYEQAVALMTAHNMKMGGVGGLDPINPMISSYSEGDVSINFNINQKDNMSADGELSLTSYGVKFISLRRKTFPAIMSAAEGY